MVYKKIILCVFSIGLIATILVGCANSQRSDLVSTNTKESSKNNIAISTESQDPSKSSSVSDLKTKDTDEGAAGSNDGTSSFYDSTNSSKIETEEQNNNSDSEKSGTPQENKSDKDDKSIVYVNKKYGFNFSLPNSWDKYSIVTDNWEGRSFDASQGDKVIETGPLISIRHPLWTKKNPRQDIPIMIFTFSQWSQIVHEELIVSAAPMIPSEICRNSKYVFALPPRYNYAFITGYEEVEDILNGNPINAIDNWK